MLGRIRTFLKNIWKLRKHLLISMLLLSTRLLILWKSHEILFNTNKHYCRAFLRCCTYYIEKPPMILFLQVFFLSFCLVFLVALVMCARGIYMTSHARVSPHMRAYYPSITKQQRLLLYNVFRILWKAQNICKHAALN